MDNMELARQTIAALGWQLDFSAHSISVMRPGRPCVVRDVGQVYGGDWEWDFVQAVREAAGT